LEEYYVIIQCTFRTWAAIDDHVQLLYLSVTAGFLPPAILRHRIEELTIIDGSGLDHKGSALPMHTSAKSTNCVQECETPNLGYVGAELDVAADMKGCQLTASNIGFITRSQVET
jgi:hypothetical protein